MTLDVVEDGRRITLFSVPTRPYFKVIIVENSFDPENTQALILSLNMKVVAEPVCHFSVCIFSEFSCINQLHCRGKKSRSCTEE